MSDSPARLYLDGCLTTEDSRTTTTSALRMLYRLLPQSALVRLESGDPLDFPWHRLTLEEVARARQQLAKRYAVTTANRLIAALNGVLTSAWRMRLLDADELTRLKPSSLRGVPMPRGQHVEAPAIARMVLAAASSSTRARRLRDPALVLLLATTGIRCIEAHRMRAQDLQASGHVRVSGKGGRMRLAVLPADTLDAVESWLGVRGHGAGPLFQPVEHGHILARPLTRQAIGKAIRRAARDAGLPEPFPTPHDLRRSYATGLLASGVDLALVCDLLGHADVTTTTRYDLRGQGPRDAAARAFGQGLARALERARYEGKQPALL